MLGKVITKNIFLILGVAIFGFVLLNGTFVLDWLFQSLIMWIIKPFIRGNPFYDYQWLPPLLHFLFLVIICLISRFVFKSKSNVFLKASFLTVPAAVVLVTIGIIFYRWPAIAFSIGAIVLVGTLVNFKKSGQPWLYYYAVILVALVLVVMTITGTEI